MTTPLTDQIRDYFADVEAQQGAIDIDALFEHRPPRLAVVDGSSPVSTRPRTRWWAGVAAAATVVALVAGLVVLRSIGDGDEIIPAINDTIPVTSDGPVVSAPTTESAPPPTTPELTSPTPLGTATLSGDEIRVTPDSIEYGDDLWLLADRVARDDGLTYVLAYRVDGERRNPLFEETGVLAAFDDDGAERWRIDLDRTPSDVVVVDGDPWVLQLANNTNTVSRIDASDGQVLGRVTLSPTFSQTSHWLVGAYGAVWIAALPAGSETPDSTDLVRIEPDLSFTTIDLPGSAPLIGGTDISRGERITPGAGAMWVPLGDDGVATVDPDTNQVTVISDETIGHPVDDVAVDGDVVYVASGVMPFAITNGMVTSIVDQQVLDTVSLPDVPQDFPIRYLGPVDGDFGVLLPDGLLADGLRQATFRPLTANEPMLGEEREISTDDRTFGLAEIDGETWVETLGPGNWGLHRIQILPVADQGG